MNEIPPMCKKSIYIYTKSINQVKLLEKSFSIKTHLLFPTGPYLTLFAKVKDTHFACYVGNINANTPLLRIKKKNK